MIVPSSPWPGVPHQWHLRPAPTPGPDADPGEPFGEEPVDVRVVAAVLGLVVLVVLAVAPLLGPDAAAVDPATVGVAE